MRIEGHQLSLAIINGYSFYKLGVQAKDHFDSEHSPEEFLLHLVPACVNLCLSAEIMLKVLISQFNLDFRKTHNLLNLYDLLPDCIKTSFDDGYKKVRPDCKEPIRNEVKSISDAFTEWRYYGIDPLRLPKKLEIDFIFVFSTMLKNLVLKINTNTAELIKRWDLKTGKTRC